MLDVLLADDDDNVRETVGAALVAAGHRVTEAKDGAVAADLASSHVFDLAICDVHMPRVDGLALLRRIRRESPATAVIIMTGFGDIRDVVGSLRDGAIDYVTKPFDTEHFTRTVIVPLDQQTSVRKKLEVARASFVGRAAGASLISVSPPMHNLADRIAMLAHSDAPVLITGDRGTGKELVARTIHVQGPRRGGPFVIVDAAVLPERLREAEEAALSYEGTPRHAWYDEAEGGTLVLDGVDALSLAAQSKLARVIGEPSERARRRSGWTPRGVRVLTLTRTRLAARVAAGQILESLYFRLNAFELHVPSLAEREEDWYPLVAQLLREIQPLCRTTPSITAAASRALRSYAFPGNVRELRWTLEHALVMADGDPIDIAHLPPDIFMS